MLTSSSDGTTDGNFVNGIESYLFGTGLFGDFVVKVSNEPNYYEYQTELDADEDVLVGITYPGGGGHWLVGRSYGPLDDAGTPGDPSDDYYPVSFVDPGTGAVYHSKMRLSDDAIWYNGQWVEFDIMVSVSPHVVSNPDTAQIWLAQNGFYSEPGEPGYGDFTFTLLADTPPLPGNQDGRSFVGRMTLEARAPGETRINCFNPIQGQPPAVLIGLDPDGFPIPLGPVNCGDQTGLLAIIQVEAGVRAETSLFQAQELDPSFGGPFIEWHLDAIRDEAGQDISAGTPLSSYHGEFSFDPSCLQVLAVENGQVVGNQIVFDGPDTVAPAPLGRISARLIGDLNTDCSIQQVDSFFRPVGSTQDGDIPGSPPANITMKRGNADANPDTAPSDGSVDIGDALAIARYTVNLPGLIKRYECSDPTRPPGEKCLLAVNAAHDNLTQGVPSGGDIIDIGDALLIAQCEVGRQNDLCPAPQP